MTSPLNSTPSVDSAGVYNDFAGLAALKKSAHTNDPTALRQVAKQYESLFARMMIKSMRDAVGKDPIFGSDQEDTYQGMYDDQLSIEMTKGHGLGLADMLVKQMQRTGLAGASPAASPTGDGASKSTPTGSTSWGGKLSTRTPPTAGTTSSAASPATKAAFVTDLLPAAQQAGQELGVDPSNLIAQAALETDWGTRVPRDASGHSSNNLFGVKAGNPSNGASMSAATQEYQNGAPVSTTAQFRSYDSQEESFQDYVSLLRSNPRYAAALNTGGNVQAFAAALQRGGYATDPNYASKITAIASGVSQRTAADAQPLKSASVQPINPNTGIL
jgi:peptidoglycan hydrolase FlgJ